jgi:hypothetical protein
VPPAFLQGKSCRRNRPGTVQKFARDPTAAPQWLLFRIAANGVLWRQAVPLPDYAVAPGNRSCGRDEAGQSKTATSRKDRKSDEVPKGALRRKAGILGIGLGYDR